jgi:hypothetical protein
MRQSRQDKRQKEQDKDNERQSTVGRKDERHAEAGRTKKKILVTSWGGGVAPLAARDDMTYSHRVSFLDSNGKPAMIGH